jgi:hypothetical protein
VSRRNGQSRARRQRYKPRERELETRSKRVEGRKRLRRSVEKCWELELKAQSARFESSNKKRETHKSELLCCRDFGLHLFHVLCRV